MSDSHPSQHTEQRELSTSTTVAPHLADYIITAHTHGVNPDKGIPLPLRGFITSSS